jgi:hypothetical protein
LGLLDPSEVCFSVTDYEEGPPEEEIGWISGDGQYFGEIKGPPGHENFTGLIALRTISCEYVRDSNVPPVEAYVAVLDSAVTKFVPTTRTEGVAFIFDRQYSGWDIVAGEALAESGDNWRWEPDEGGDVNINGTNAHMREIEGVTNGTGFIHASIKVAQNSVESSPLEDIVPFFVVAPDHTFLTRENGDDTVYAVITDGVCKFRVVSGHQTVTIENATKGTVLEEDYQLPEWRVYNGIKLYSHVFEFSDPDVQHLDVVWVHGSDGDALVALIVHLMAWKHRPVLWMHPDEFSKFGPIKVEKFVGNADLMKLNWLLEEGHETVKKKGMYTLGDLMSDAYNTETHYLNLDPDNTRTLGPEQGNETVYWIDKMLNKDHLGIQYWFFYMSSSSPYIAGLFQVFGHEGDWEMCMVVLDINLKEGQPPAIGLVEPVSMAASQHYSGQTVRWQELVGVKGEDWVEKFDKDKNRPVVYIAKDGHATYFRDGKIKTTLYTDVTGKGNQVNVAGENLVRFPEFAPNNWYCWKGYWGDLWKGNRDVPFVDYRRSGPRSPKYRKDDNRNMLIDGARKWHNDYVGVRYDGAPEVERTDIIIPP